MNKSCARCLQEKPTSEFYGMGKNGKLQSLCKRCYNDYCMERWSKRKSEAVLSKGGICEHCLIAYPDCVFDFHHVDPSAKEFNWPKMRQLSKTAMYAELNKCILLCANCHRIHHWQ